MDAVSYPSLNIKMGRTLEGREVPRNSSFFLLEGAVISS